MQNPVFYENQYAYFKNYVPMLAFLVDIKGSLSKVYT